MKRTAFFVILGTLICASNAASSTPTRYHLKPGKTLTQAHHYFENGFNKQTAISGTVCRFTNGTRSSGWLHIACVGEDNVKGEIHRFSAVYTPVSCTAMRIQLIITGVARTTQRVGWAADSPVRCRAG